MGRAPSKEPIMELDSSATKPDYPIKKRRGPGHFFKVALYMLKQTKSHKKNANVHSNSFWKSFVDSVRPLCVQNPQPPPLLTGFPPSPVTDHMEVFTPPMSPAPAGMSVSSSCGNMSYASALNLQELDQDQTEEIDQRHDDDDGSGSNGDEEGDDTIDAKAEQFIAQFYLDIKAQNQVHLSDLY